MAAVAVPKHVSLPVSLVFKAEEIKEGGGSEGGADTPPPPPPLVVSCPLLAQCSYIADTIEVRAGDQILLTHLNVRLLMCCVFDYRSFRWAASRPEWATCRWVLAAAKAAAMVRRRTPDPRRPVADRSLLHDSPRFPRRRRATPWCTSPPRSRGRRFKTRCAPCKVWI